VSEVTLRDQARTGVEKLEEFCGVPLASIPVAQRDQWCAGVRETFREMGVDLDNDTQALAAFTGAHVIMATIMMPTQDSGVRGVHVLRYLLNKSEGAKDASWWRRSRIWLSGKILPQ